MSFRQLSYTHGIGNIPLLPYTIGQMLNKTAEKYPDNEMYVFCADNKRYTFRNFKEKTHQFAAGLLQLGLQKGDTLGVWGHVHAEYMLAYHACAQIGLIFVRLITPPVTDINGKLMTRTGCKALVLTRTPTNAYSELCKLIPELPNSAPGKLTSTRYPDLKVIIGPENTFSNCKGLLTVEELIKLGAEACKQIPELTWGVSNEDDFSILFTSGSTGVPKATVHSHQSLLNTTRMTEKFWKASDIQHDRVLKSALLTTPATIGHEYQLLQPLLTGNTTVFLCPVFDVTDVLKNVERERCTNVSCLIIHIYQLANHPDAEKYDWSSMEILRAGGSVIPDNLMKKARKLSKHVMLSYGATECCVNFHQNPEDDPEKRARGYVYPMPYTEVKVVDDSGHIVATNTAGEIFIRSFSLFKRYLGDDAATQEAKTEDGWFRTGDIGEIDDDSYLRILGRKKDIIIKGGPGFFPKELEMVLEQHVDVSAAVVFGVPDEQWSEEVCACIKLNPSASATDSQSLKAFCKGKVHDLLVPGHVFIIQEIPTTTTGKFHRRELREWAMEQLKIPHSS